MKQDEPDVNEILTIRREPLLWMLLGWAISWGLGWAIGFNMADVIRDSIKSSYNLLPDDLYSLYIAAGLFIGGSLCGLIVGISMIFVLWKENILSNKRSIIVISLGWILGFTIGIGIFSFEDIVQFVLIWLIAGVMMAWILSPHIKVENQIRAFIWIIFGWLIGGGVCAIVVRLGFDYVASLGYPEFDIDRAIREVLFVLIGWIIGIVIGIVITTLVLIKEKPLDYLQIFLRIVFGLIGIVLILLVSAFLSGLRFNIDDFAYFVIHNVISGVIGWRIMIWVLRKNIFQK